MSISINDRRARFEALHESGCFVIPNPSDRGTARLLAKLGFGALEITSAGLQFRRGEPDTVFAPGVGRRADIEEIVRPVAPNLVNVLVSGDFGLSVADLSKPRRPPRQRGFGAGPYRF